MRVLKKNNKVWRDLVLQTADVDRTFAARCFVFLSKIE